jgi:hypothetical protein
MSNFETASLPKHKKRFVPDFKQNDYKPFFQEVQDRSFKTEILRERPIVTIWNQLQNRLTLKPASLTFGQVPPEFPTEPSKFG